MFCEQFQQHRIDSNRFKFFYHAGVGLAILEKAQMISPIVDNEGTTTSAGTVSAGYQNFFICLEMLCAAIALRYAFPYQVRNNQKRSLSIMLRLRID